MPKPNFLLTRFPSESNPKPILVPRKEVDWEGGAVFNPTVIIENGNFIMLYRAFSSALKVGEPRYYRPGFKLVNNVSFIGIAESSDGENFIRNNKPLISPSETYDNYGCEDPRVTKFEDYYYITYTAIDAPLWEKDTKPNIRIALARTKDFVSIEKLGIVGPTVKSKAACIWPERVKGKIGFAFTENADSINSSVKIKYFNNIREILVTTEWTDSLTMLKTEKWLHRGPELGAVPLKTDKGWLMVFSSESMTDSWSVSAALFDLEDPHKMIGRTKGFVLEPAADYERNGLVPNVVFPSGAVLVGDEIWVYYGAADTVIGLAKGRFEDLLKTITLY
ncbi:MAG: hypothetical protein WCT01_00290 [Candidatus Shapirobacteria bacterium]